MQRKGKHSPGAGKMKENKPKRQRVTITEALKNSEMPTGVSLGYMQSTIDGFVANYLALGPIDIFSNTELAFLAILSTTCMCATVSEIYVIIKKLFPKENLPKDYEKRIRNVLVEVGCFAVYKPDSQPKPGTKTWKIKTLYCVIPHELVAKVSTGFYRKSAEQKKIFRESQYKWANYGPEVKDLWTNVSRFVAMQTQTRIDEIKYSDDPLETLNSPSISTSSQIDVKAETKSFHPTVSTPGQTGVTAETEPEMDCLSLSQDITSDPAVELLTTDLSAEYPTSANGACGTTWDSNMLASQTSPPRPDMPNVKWGSHLSQLPEPPSYPFKPVPDTPSEGPKLGSGAVLTALIKANNEKYYIFGHEFTYDGTYKV